MQRVGTVDKCFDLLEAILSAGEDGLGVREMARRLEINPTTVHNLCWTLIARGYLRQDQRTKRFQLGPRFMPLAQSAQVWRSLADTVQTLVRRCREELDESILLAVMEHSDISTLIYLPSTQALRVHEPRAMRDLAYGTAVGKVLLADLSDDELSHYLEQFPPQRYTDHSVTDPNEIRRELESVRRQGYAVSCDEVAMGVSAVAIPIRDLAGATVGGFGASAPTARMDAAQAKRTRTVLLQYGEAITKTWFQQSRIPRNGRTSTMPAPE